MRKILVTGGAGNIGSQLVTKLVENEDNYVVVADDLSTGSLSKLPNSGYIFTSYDVNKMTPVLEDFDYIFHFAAVVGVQRTQDNPTSVLEDIEGIKNILNLAEYIGAKRVFYASSSEVYGEPVSIPQNEDETPLNSRLPYAVVKNVGECFCRSYHKEYGLDYTIFRFFNTYGPNQSTDFVVPRFIEAAKSNKDITIYGDGLQTRTFTYVEDTVDTCLACMYDDKMINDTINIGSDKMYTILDLAKLIIKLTKSKSKIVHLPPLKEGDMTRRQPDNTKMKKILGRDLISLEEGIKKMI
jgi:UDP-glucose 4-epimerase